MKFQKISTILIWSENYKPLADWYQHTFDLKIEKTINHPMDTGVRFEFPDGGVGLWVGAHSKVKGKNREPDRIMFNITVDSVQAAYEELKRKGVTFFATPFKAPTMEKYCATLYDPDGNLIQIFGSK